jgi:hypothetical protein
VSSFVTGVASEVALLASTTVAFTLLPGSTRSASGFPDHFTLKAASSPSKRVTSTGLVPGLWTSTSMDPPVDRRTSPMLAIGGANSRAGPSPRKVTGMSFEIGASMFSSALMGLTVVGFTTTSKEICLPAGITPFGGMPLTSKTESSSDFSAYSASTFRALATMTVFFFSAPHGTASKSIELAEIVMSPSVIAAPPSGSPPTAPSPSSGSSSPAI